MDKNLVYMWLHTASIKSTAGNKTRFFPSPVHVSTSSRLISAGEFCRVAFRSATEENESGGYVTFPCPSKVTRHSSTADWLKF